MKNSIITLGSLCALFCSVFTGCTTVPSASEMHTLGKVSGYTAAYVLNKQVKIDDATRNTIISVTTEVEKYIPNTNETFAIAWTPIAQTYVDKLVAEDKITKTVADIVMKEFGYVVGLLDTYVDNKGVRQYQDVVDAFVHGFCDSFITNLNTSSAFSTPNMYLDEFTYDYMMKAGENK